MLTGNTVDISMLLRFHWYERVYFRTEDAPFPSTSKETAGYFVGFNDHVGHQLTFAILCDETKRIVYRSEVRYAENPFTINRRADNWGDQDSPEIIRSTIDDSITAETKSKPMDIIDVEDLVGRTFSLPDKKRGTATIVEAINKHEEDNSARKKFKILHNKDKFEEILSYNEIIDHIERSENAPVMWELDEIIGHQGPLIHTHPNYDGSPYNVTVR